ncbi:MAG: hypothetical protein JW722_02390 [Demequinaceae bacterium]|nr:hypothetical protein [Demequinaceae bacterium]
MTRLSDLLRGAADRAPIGEASVSIQTAHRRVRIQRGVRGAANGLAGAGAAALVFVGIVNPAITAATGQDDVALAPVPAEDDGGRTLGGPETDAYYNGGWGVCGSYVDTAPVDPDPSLSLTVDSGDLVDLEGGTVLDLPARLTATEDLTITFSLEAVILYEGMVVARLDAAEAEQILALASGDTADSSVSLPLVNCFDGAALPAAKYELVVSQAFSHTTDEPGPEPTMEPTPVPEPTMEPTPVPEPEPSPSSIGTTTDMMAPEPMPVEPEIWWEARATAPSVTLSIAGDPVDDPFGDYIWSPPEKPDDILTPAKARELYEAGLVSGTWDMAPGTSRWIIPNYEEVSSLDSMRKTSSGWYGCSWDGSTGVGFPTESAVLDLLDVSMTFPSRINLSYGWVVDGNPQVHITVTNTSEYSLPGFYGEPSRTLYLVKDGRVVAESWPQNIRPYSDDLVREHMAADSDEYWGTLSPGADITGDYLWRDLNGCWTENGPRSVTSGTYTLVTSQSIYIDSSNGEYPVLYAEDDVTEAGDGQSEAPVPAVDSGAREDTIEIDPVIAPDIEPDYLYDWVELQMWTSLGTVTITTS